MRNPLIATLCLVCACAQPTADGREDPADVASANDARVRAPVDAASLHPTADSGSADPVRAPALDSGPDRGTDSATPGAGADVEAEAAVPAMYEARALVGPNYQGSVDSSAECSRSYPTRGFEPLAAPGARHPLFLYFVGTAFVANDPSATHESLAALAVTEAMARRGFVALSVQYDNGALAWLSDHQNQLACLFDAAAQASLIATACALPQVDCELGVATWGHSQGGYVAAIAHNLEPRVRAVWATGYGGDAAETIERSRLRVVNGEADTTNGTAATLNRITGLTPADCPDPDRCLRADGSGWIIVRKADLALPQSSTADHCWFDRRSCIADSIVLEPNWIDPSSDKAFALERNADWIARTVRR